MHSIFLTTTKLSRTNTALCCGGSGEQIFQDNCLVIKRHINCIDSNCFDEWYIGPGGSLIFEGFVYLKPHSITSPLITNIVFKQDARLSRDAFFSKTANSNMYKNYVLFCYKDSNVEKFAKRYGFKFHTLDEFIKPKDKISEHWVCSYSNNVLVEKSNCFLRVNEDRFIFCKRAEKRNGDYIFIESPFIKDSFKKGIDTFIKAFSSVATPREKEKYVFNTGSQLFLTISLNKKNLRKYLLALQKAFKDTAVENYLRYFDETDDGF